LVGAGAVALVGGRATLRRTARAPTERALTGVAAVAVLHVLWVAVGPRDLVDPTPFAVALGIAAVARGLLAHTVRDVVPMARELLLLRSPDPVLVLDPWRRVLQANAAAAEMLDAAGPADLVGRAADEVLRDQPDLRRAVEVGAAVELEVAWSRHPVERRFRARTTPVPDRRGRRSGQLLYLQDVAREVLVDQERRVAERDLEEQRRYTSLLLDAAGDLVAAVAPEDVPTDLLRRATEAVRSADAALYRVARDGHALERWRAVGRLATDLDAPTAIGEDLAGRAWRDRAPVSVDDYLAWPERARGAQAAWVRAALAVPLFDGQEAHGALLLVRPRADRRTFSGGEMAVLVGLARLGALALARERRADEVLELRREAAALAAKLERIHAPARGPARGPAPKRATAAPAWRFEAVDLADVVRRAARAADGRADRRPEVELVLDVPDGLPSVIGDPERLLRVTAHLIDRALATTRVGCVVLSLGRDHDPEVGDALVLRVRDTGEGGDADALARAFGPPASGGSGVLHACARVIERHGGRLWSNRSPRSGATVAIVVPLVAAPTAPAAPNVVDG
jgi:signal transduction histidine kinase